MTTQNSTWLGCLLLVQWRAGRPQWEAAGVLEMSPTQLSRYENGDRPSDRLKERIAEKTGDAVPIASWFELVELAADEPAAEAG